MSEEIFFWESGGISYKKVMVKGVHQTKPIMGYCVSGIIKGTDNRLDVSIGNKWSYLTPDEQKSWIDNAKSEITKELLK